MARIFEFPSHANESKPKVEKPADVAVPAEAEKEEAQEKVQAPVKNSHKRTAPKNPEI